MHLTAPAIVRLTYALAIVINGKAATTRDRMR